MPSLNLYATTAGRVSSHELSSNNSAIPTAIVLPRRKIVAFPATANGNNSGRFSFKLKAQYLAPQEQNHQQPGFSSFESPFPSQPVFSWSMAARERLILWEPELTSINKKMVPCVLPPELFSQPTLTNFTPGQFPPRVYVGYSVYKGKAAITVEPRPPEFSPLGSGAFKISKEGFVLLQFAPAVGVRQYDWGRKQIFSLSVTEIGNIISLGARDSCEFFHDPFKGKSDEGRVRKILKVEPLPDGSGHFFNLSVQNKITNVDESIYIPITRAEFAVLVSSFNFVLPYLLGWHTFANAIKPDDTNRTNSGKPGSAADFEWNR